MRITFEQTRLFIGEIIRNSVSLIQQIIVAFPDADVVMTPSDIKFCNKLRRFNLVDEFVN